MKQTEIKDLLSIPLRFVSIAVIFLLTYFVMAQDFKLGEIKENGYVENTQLLFLGITMIILVVIAVKYTTLRLYNSILALFFFTHFIRENDARFEDYLFEYAWNIPAYSAVLVAIILLAKNWKKYLNQLYSVKESIHFGILIVGVAILHLFSRLYGKKTNWMGLFEIIDAPMEQYRSIKDASEECVELLAYSIILYSVFELIFVTKKLSNTTKSDRQD